MKRFALPGAAVLLFAAATLTFHLVTAGGSAARSGRATVLHTRAGARGAVLSGRKLAGLSSRAVDVRVPASAPLVGSEGPLAVPSRNGALLAYNTWRWARPIDWHEALGAQGIHSGDDLGTPTLRIRELDTGRDVALEPGSLAAAWRRSGAIAYVRGTHPEYRANTPYLREVVVRSSPRAAPRVWSDAPERYLVLGWAGRRLVVAQQREGGGADLLVYDGPGVVRPLATAAGLLAISPDGSTALIADDPAETAAPAVRLVSVADGSERARLPLSSIVDPVTSAAVTWVDGPGDWTGERVVASSSTGLVVLRVRGGSVSTEQLLHVDSATRPNGTLWEPRFADGGERTILTWTDVSNGEETQSAQLVCDRFTRTCSETGPVAASDAPRPVYDQSGGDE
jgi:hypothetical protein